MKHIIFLILKKRWFLILLLLFLGFAMNTVIWNEGSQFIRQWPRIERLRQRSSDYFYEVLYIPSADINHIIIENSQSEKEQLGKLLMTTLAHEPTLMIYQGKQSYLEVTSQDFSKELEQLTPVELEQLVTSDLFRPDVLDNLLVESSDEHVLANLEKATAEQGFQITFQTLSQRASSEWHYYFFNLLFALVFITICSLLILLTVYHIVQQGTKLLRSELRLLRVLGQSEKSQTMFLTFFLYFPFILAFLIFQMLPYLTGIGMVWQDYVYLPVLNTFLLYVINVLVTQRLRRLSHD